MPKAPRRLPPIDLNQADDKNVVGTIIRAFSVNPLENEVTTNVPPEVSRDITPGVTQESSQSSSKVSVPDSAGISSLTSVFESSLTQSSEFTRPRSRDTGRTQSRKAENIQGLAATKQSARADSQPQSLEDTLYAAERDVQKLSLDIATGIAKRLKIAVNNYGRGSQRKIVEQALDEFLTRLKY